MKYLYQIIFLLFYFSNIGAQNWEVFATNFNENEFLNQTINGGDNQVLLCSNLGNNRFELPYEFSRFTIINSSADTIYSLEYKIDSLDNYRFHKGFYDKTSDIYTLMGTAFNNDSLSNKYFHVLQLDATLNTVGEDMLKIGNNGILYKLEGNPFGHSKYIAAGQVQNEGNGASNLSNHIFKVESGEIKAHYVNDNVFSTLSLVSWSAIKNPESTGFIGFGEALLFLDEDLNLISQDSDGIRFGLSGAGNFDVLAFSDKYLVNTLPGFDAPVPQQASTLAMYVSTDFEVEQFTELGSIANSIPIINQALSFVDSNKIYIATYNRGLAGPLKRYFTLYQLDKNLKEVYSLEYGNDDKRYYASSIEATEDGGVIICGGYRIIGNVFPFHPFYIKFDCNGLIVSTSEPEDSNLWSVVLYENPSSGNFRLLYEGPDNQLDLVIYDLQGRLVHQDQLYTRQEYQHNLSSMPSSTYTYSLINSGKIVYTGKWVKN